MNKTELVNAAAKRTALTIKETEAALNAVLEVMEESLLAEDKVQITGFGTFDIKKQDEREGRNPQSGEPMKIAASKSPKFKAGKALKDALNA